MLRPTRGLACALVDQVHRTRWVGTAGKCRYPYYLLDMGEIVQEGPKEGLQINGHTAELARKG